MSTSVRLGAFVVRELPDVVAVEGETPTGSAARGRGRLLEVRDDAGLRLTVRDTTWSNGERDLVVCERHHSPQRFDTLVERLRLPVTERGRGLYAELRHVRLRSNGRGNLFAPDRAELDGAAGFDVVDALEREGGCVGTRGELLADGGPARHRLGVRFPHAARMIPAMAYVCTRVAPVAGDVRA